MVMRKKTLRRLSPVARKVARLAGEADSLGRRLKNLVAEIQELELDSRALKHARDKGYTQVQVSESILSQLPDQTQETKGGRDEVSTENL